MLARGRTQCRWGDADGSEARGELARGGARAQPLTSGRNDDDRRVALLVFTRTVISAVPTPVAITFPFCSTRATDVSLVVNTRPGGIATGRPSDVARHQV